MRKNENGFTHHIVMTAVAVLVLGLIGFSVTRVIKNGGISAMAANKTFYNSDRFGANDKFVPVSFAKGINVGYCKTSRKINKQQVWQVFLRSNFLAPGASSTGKNYAGLDVSRGGKTVDSVSLVTTIGQNKLGSVYVYPSLGDSLNFSSGDGNRGGAGPLDINLIQSCDGSQAPLAIGFSISPTTNITIGSTIYLTWQTSGRPTSCIASGGWSGTKASSGSETIKIDALNSYHLTCKDGTVMTVAAAIPTLTATPNMTSTLMGEVVSPYATTLETPKVWACKDVYSSANGKYYRVNVKTQRSTNTTVSIASNTTWSYANSNWFMIGNSRGSTWNSNVTYTATYAESDMDKIGISYQTATSGSSFASLLVSSITECSK